MERSQPAELRCDMGTKCVTLHGKWQDSLHIIWHFCAEIASRRSDHQAFPGGLHDANGDAGETVHSQDSFGL
jgi:hypothetical protein